VQGGTIHGVVVAGAPGKPGAVPLPGVAVTATNTLTGRKYTAATDIDGVYAMSIPKNGRYVVRAELTGFAVTTAEVVLDGDLAASTAKATDFGMELASRAEAAAARQEAAANTTAGQARGVQNLTLSSGLDSSTEDASAGQGNTGVSMPTLSSLNDSVTGEAAGAGADSIAVSGQQAQMNGLANVSEDELRERVQEAVDRARENGQGGDTTMAIAGAMGTFMAGGGPPGGGGRPGKPGHGGPGFGNFRSMNPAQPHGTIYWTGGNNALNSAPWSPSLVALAEPAGFQNRFGLSLMGTPYIPGLTKPDTRQFVFININGQKNLTPYAPNPVRVPTELERAGDFSQSYTRTASGLVAAQLYDPVTGLPIPGNNLANASVPVSQQALAVLSNYYPHCNINCGSTDPSVYNYQTVTNTGNNNVSLNSRYIRNFGQQAAGGPFAGFRNHNTNAKPTLRQNMNLGFNYAHSASDIRNIFLALGGATETNGYGLNAGYVIGYGRFSDNISVNWNRSRSETRNYFTDTAVDPTAVAGISVPNRTNGFADPNFYNGLPTLSLSNYQSLTNTTPSNTVNQTISFSDTASWRHKGHNLRGGFDLRRVHADTIGGNNALGSFSFTGFATESPTGQKATIANQDNGQPVTGNGLADFLLGLPTQTAIQAGLAKFYLRQWVMDAYANDDFRLANNLTINYGVRWEYFSPFVEKFNRLANVDHDATYATLAVVQPGATGPYSGAYPRSLVNPQRDLFSPRFGFAYRLKNKGLTKDTVLRGGYGINYTTNQYQNFARKLAYEPPFAAVQTNVPTTDLNHPTGCYTTTSQGVVSPLGTAANMTLANGFACVPSNVITNNYGVDKNYRVGMVQVFNLNVQRTLGSAVVLNVGYSGSVGRDLDFVGNPNQNGSTVTSPYAQSFLYETDLAGSRFNSLVASAQMRQHKGISGGLFYTYGHSIDNASSIGGGSATTVQDFFRPDLEESNSSFDRRHSLSMNWVLELPFGPNRAFLNKGGVAAQIFDGWGLSGTANIASGAYYTPQYSSSVSEALAGGNYIQRPDRNFSQPINGPRNLTEWFNKAAFADPASPFGTASRYSIEGPGTLTTNVSLSRNFSLGETRSFEARMTASNVFNTVQYNGINTTVNSYNVSQVTSAASMRQLSFIGRFRF
jgi:hypothetical protein